jgi:hypothetical protein
VKYAELELPGNVELESPDLLLGLELGFKRSGRKICASTYPAAIYHPLGPPVVVGTTITVDTALKSPTRVTRTLMDLTLQRFFADRVLTNAGGVTGGAVVYDELQANDLYLTRDIERVEPGMEFPLVTSERRIPKVALVEKWGGKFYTTDEARDRNNISEYTRHIRQLANTIVRKINQRAVETLEAAITSGSRTVTGRNWSTVVTAGSAASNANLWPARDFMLAQTQAETEELGMVYDLWIMNPQEYMNLATIYGSTLADLLNSLGLDIYVTNRVAPGTAYVCAAGQVGEMRVEQGLATETWRDGRGTQKTWTQSSVRPLWFVDNKFALLKFTGLNG